MSNTTTRNLLGKKVSKIRSETVRRKRLRLETLESRRLLAGGVTATVVDGDLFVVGDRDANAIVIRQAEDGADQFIIRGLVTDDGVQTTINGEARIIVDGVTGDINASMRGGDDLIYIRDSDLPGNLIVRTGSGNDTVLVGGLPRDGSPRPEPVPADLIDIAFSERDIEAVDSADLDDPVLVDPPSVPPLANVTIAGSARINTSNGMDRVMMGSVEVNRNMSINTGRQADKLRLGINELPGPVDDDATGISLPVSVRGSLNLNTGRGDDLAWLESVAVARNMRVNLGGGDDVMSYTRGKVGEKIAINGSLGNDRIGLGRLRADTIQINAGRGDDGVGLGSVTARRLGVRLGAGNDKMLVANTTARVARFNGGSGTDSLEFQGVNELHDLAIKNFEVIS